MLVLLIIFMVTAPMLQTGVDVNLPEAKAQTIPDDEGKLILTVTKDKRVFLGKLQIPWDDVEKTLKNNAKLNADHELYLHADQALHLRRRREDDGGRQAGGRRQARHGDRPAGVDDGARDDTPRTRARSFAGLLITLALHGVSVRWPSRARTTSPSRRSSCRTTSCVAELVKLGKPRDQVLAAAHHAAAAPDGAGGRRSSCRDDPERQGRAEGSAAPGGPEDLQGAEERARSRASKLEALATPDEPTRDR